MYVPPSPWKSLAKIVILAAFLAACAKVPAETGKQSYTEFTARLLVTEPSRRWQVLVDWRSQDEDRGWLRLTHALSGRIVELRWQQEKMWLRNNWSTAGKWREITLNQLASYGIPIFPGDVARFLKGGAPDDFARRSENLWVGKRLHNTVRVTWNRDKHILKIADIRNGRIATLMIDE